MHWARRWYCKWVIYRRGRWVMRWYRCACGRLHGRSRYREIYRICDRCFAALHLRPYPTPVVRVKLDMTDLHALIQALLDQRPTVYDHLDDESV